MFHVKHSPERENTASRLRSCAADHALDLASDRLDALADLVAWLAPAAHQIGLTKYADPGSLTEHLVCPALLLLQPSLIPFIGTPLLDFGAGCGAVGLALAAALPKAQIVLADRRRRVVEFLDIAARRHGLANVDSMLVDLRRPPQALEGCFGTVLMRAFGPPEQALRAARGWLQPEGVVALWHQPDVCPTPDGLNALRTEATDLPSLVLTLYQRP
jgi:16S rRNA G527 N7-methylase RsmG